MAKGMATYSWKEPPPLQSTTVMPGQWRRWFLLGVVQLGDGKWATGGVEVNMFTGDDD
ncbi:MAG: hypothetical protein M0Z87_07475 [Actinomycetota bacterium]|nr:hypothetical protein [Actinomycetota bacterium]